MKLLIACIFVLLSAPSLRAETLREAAAAFTPVLYGGAITNGGIGSRICRNVVTALEQWRFTHFGTTAPTGSAANDADGDRDGLVNLLEFFLAADPKIASRAELPRAAREAADLTLTYTRSKAALTDIIHAVEWTNGFAVWSTSGVTEQVLSDDGTVQQVKARVPIAGAASKFMHLELSAP